MEQEEEEENFEYHSEMQKLSKKKKKTASNNKAASYEEDELSQYHSRELKQAHGHTANQIDNESVYLEPESALMKGKKRLEGIDHSPIQMKRMLTPKKNLKLNANKKNANPSTSPMLGSRGLKSKFR